MKTEQIEHVLHIDEGLSDVSVDRPKEVQGNGQLE